MQKYKNFPIWQNKSSKNTISPYAPITICPSAPLSPSPPLFSILIFSKQKHPLPKIIFQPLSVHILSTFHSYKHLSPEPQKMAFDFQYIIVPTYFSDTCKRYQPTTATFPTRYWFVNKNSPSLPFEMNFFFQICFFFVYYIAGQKC